MEIELKLTNTTREIVQAYLEKKAGKRKTPIHIIEDEQIEDLSADEQPDLDLIKQCIMEIEKCIEVAELLQSQIELTENNCRVAFTNNELTYLTRSRKRLAVLMKDLSILRLKV